MKGIFEFEVSGVKRGFKFGTYALSVACDLEKCSLDVLFRRIGVPWTEKEGDEFVEKQEPANLKTLLSCFYGAAVHYAKHTKQNVDFNEVDVSEWIDEIGLDKVNRMLAEGLTQHTPKNSKSLAEETGETVLQ